MSRATLAGWPRSRPSHAVSRRARRTGRPSRSCRGCSSRTGRRRPCRNSGAGHDQRWAEAQSRPSARRRGSPRGSATSPARRVHSDEFARATGICDRPRVSASAGCGLGRAQPRARLAGDVRRRSRRRAGEPLIDLSRHFLSNVRLEGGGKIRADGHATRVPTFYPHTSPRAACAADQNAL